MLALRIAGSQARPPSGFLVLLLQREQQSWLPNTWGITQASLQGCNSISTIKLTRRSGPCLQHVRGSTCTGLVEKTRHHTLHVLQAMSCGGAEHKCSHHVWHVPLGTSCDGQALWIPRAGLSTLIESESNHRIQHAQPGAPCVGHCIQSASPGPPCGRDACRILHAGLSTLADPGLTVTIHALCEAGQLDNALDLISRMDAPPSNQTYMCLLRACYKRKALSHAKLVSAQLSRHSQQLSGLLGDYLVVTLARCGGVEDAYAIFISLPRRTSVSWAAMISGYCNQGQSRESLRLYGYMLEDGIEPNKETFVSLLKACGNIPDLEEARRLHGEARRKGFTVDLFVGNTLVSMYGKCRSIVEAEYVFAELQERDVVSWNAMLSAYVGLGQGEKALQLYSMMKMDDTSPDSQTLLMVLKACVVLVDKLESEPGVVILLEIGQALHADARKKGFMSDGFVCNTLINLYGKCRSIVEAEELFTGMSQCSAISWNVMISGYIEQGQGEVALQLYRQMQVEGLVPNQQTFTIALQGCAALVVSDEDIVLERQPIKSMCLEIGKALHADAQRNGFASNVFVGNSLATLYGKCGIIEEAECVFQNLSERNFVSWNAMLYTYLEVGQEEKTLQLYRQMQVENLSPDHQTTIAVLQACGSLLEGGNMGMEEQQPKVTSLDIGMVLHADARRRGLTSHAFVASALVSMYGRCGSILEAECVFDGLAWRDVAAWNSLLSAYVEQAQGEKALLLNVQMQHEGMVLNQQTFVIVLQACGIFADMEETTIVNGHPIKVKSLEIGMAIYSDAWRKGLASNFMVSNTLISVYGKCGRIDEAENIFRGLLERGVVSWNAMLTAYVEQGQGSKALLLYRQMQEEGPSSVHQTFMIVLQAVALLDQEASEIEGQANIFLLLGIVQALHADTRRKGFASDLLVGNTFINLYGKCGSIIEAKYVFDGLLQRDNVSWNVMLAAYLDQGQGESALDFYKQLQHEYSSLNELTFVSGLQACSETGSLELCRQIHFGVIFAGYELMTPVKNSLLHAYGSCASMVDAKAVFDGLSEPDVLSFNSFMTGYAKEGNIEAILHLIEEMQQRSLRTDEVTFLSLLSACNHSGLVREGIMSFNLVNTFPGISLEFRHHAVMIDLVGRAGDLKKVEHILLAMPWQANLCIWLCLLGVGRKHGAVELGKQAFGHAVSLQPKEPRAYVLMSNIFADAGLHASAIEVENLGQKEGVWLKSDFTAESEVQSYCVDDKMTEKYEMLYGD